MNIRLANLASAVALATNATQGLGAQLQRVNIRLANLASAVALATNATQGLGAQLQRINIRLANLASAVALATHATHGLGQQLQRIAAEPAPAPTRNGGRRNTVAHDQRRAAKRRAIRRAKRLGHR